ncbi:MAG: hypothetical protein GXP33_13920 [Spirochaetes bacterium]|nr:hypothetical protein [Spirochaetota bacterium]
MSRIKVFLTAAVLTVSLLGCTQMFDFNLFAGMDKASVPKVSDLTAMGTDKALTYLEDEAGSDAFFDALNDDSAGKSDLEGFLQDTWTDPDASDDQSQRAALLYSDIELKTTGADEIINNLVNVLDTSGTGGMDSYTSFDDFWNAVAPGNSDPGTIFDGLNNAYTGYDVLGGLLPDTGGSGPEGTNMGEAAQNAVVAFVIHEVMDANGFTKGSELAEALDAGLPVLTMPDLSSSNPDFTNINNIIGAASPELAGLLGVQ